jgi:C-terminal processing protease CtpA/Prc
MPGGWRGGPPGTIFTEDKVVHGGKRSVRLERQIGSPNTFSTITKSIPINFSGTTLELRGFLGTEVASDFVGLWMREDGDVPALEFDNMHSRQLKGTNLWKEYSISLLIHPQAKELVFGVLLAGTGKAWADDLQLLVDGKPVWEAPPVRRAKTVLDTDHEFDTGSRVQITHLSKVQIDNLAVLGKVWGFLKYYHPTVTAGHRHWDYELFRVLPEVLSAPDRSVANRVIGRWVDSLGAVSRCHPCARLDETELQFGPDLDWIANTELLGSELSQKLMSIRDNRVPAQQFFVSKISTAGNPSFDHELGYAQIKLPDFGFQLLALYRFWNIFEYWSPYRNVVGEGWTSILEEFIPRVAAADSADSYRQELVALTARAHDGHANLWRSLDIRPPMGNCRLPISVRFIENLPTVTGLSTPNVDSTAEIEVGDVITQLDGVSTSKLIESWKPYYAASNDTGRLDDIARSMTRGKCGDSEIAVRRGDKEFNVRIKRMTPSIAQNEAFHDLPGPTFRLLSKDVAYLKLSSVKAGDCATYVNAAADTQGLIIDVRNYPSEFVVFALGSLLVEAETPFALFTEGDLTTPGAFHWTPPVSLSPTKPHYTGKIVILADETSISQAEYTIMAFRSAHRAIIVGSQTKGADGNVSPFSLPGGLNTLISGIGVFYPDKRPTQRVGIVPDVEVKPTIGGIRASRDEVLEEAVRQILGHTVVPAKVRELYQGVGRLGLQ